MTISIETDEIREAIDRIARTPDGHLLYRFFQKTLCAVAAGNVDDGALRQHEGRRRFASEMMGLMAKGIDDSDRYAITFSVSGAVRANSGPRGAGRRVTLDTHVPGYDDTERSS
jgi:hypothetical protein